MKVLLAGWFSFDGMGATAGDLIVRDKVAAWLTEAGIDFDVALAPPFEGGVDWRLVDPGQYSHAVFACGPFGNGLPLSDFLFRFGNLKMAGVDLSMLEPVEDWNPFDFLLERDSSRTTRPDVALAATTPQVPVAGLVLVHKQQEYDGRSLHDDAEDAFRRLIDDHSMATVPIDTRIEGNSTGLRDASEIESVIARMDVVLTTRLHGLVLALKNGIPALAIDPISKGAKISGQAATLGWPAAAVADDLDPECLDELLKFCLSDEGREAARRCSERSQDEIEEVGRQLIDFLRQKENS